MPDLDWDDPPVRIRCSTELELQVNCSEAEANLTVSSINGMSPFIKFMGSCNFSSGDSRETIVVSIKLSFNKECWVEYTVKTEHKQKCCFVLGNDHVF